ncbi:MAG: hypothetical protein QOE85_1303, partial [Actinomycetota bacterium]|nr:hypothetical protein [Actinomycetota bacterium]
MTVAQQERAPSGVALNVIERGPKT